MRVLRAIVAWFRRMWLKLFFRKPGYEIKMTLPASCVGRLQPIKTSTRILDHMAVNERYMLAYNVAREIRRMEELAEGDEDRVLITLPLIVQDSILAESFTQELKDLVELQDQIGERTDGRYIPQQLS